MRRYLTSYSLLSVTDEIGKTTKFALGEVQMIFCDDGILLGGPRGGPRELSRSISGSSLIKLTYALVLVNSRREVKVQKMEHIFKEPIAVEEDMLLPPIFELYPLNEVLPELKDAEQLVYQLED